MRTKDLLRVAPYVGRTLPELLSVECWGGATYDVALRFLQEDPWERLAVLRHNMPGLCLQMLLRGRNTVGYTPYPTKVTTSFVAEAAEVGIDIFRIFDALNDVEQMRPAIDAVRETGTTIAEVALCYTADLNDPDETLYTLDYYLRLAEQIVDAGAHVLAIKDMAGLLRPPAAAKLVSALRERFDLPVHLHTHDTAGGQLATLLAAVDAGVDAVDVASAPMAATTSQPPASALVAALAHTERATHLDLRAVMDLEPYWEAVRKIYAPFESGLPSPTGRVYDHEIPGGQLSNLRQQAIALGLGDRFEAVEATYAAASRILGRPTKVTPSSKVVGDLALQLVAIGADPADFEANPKNYDIPDSVIGFLNGELGDPPGGWPEPFRTKALEGRVIPVRDVELAEEDSAAAGRAGPERQRTLNRLLFPGPTKDFTLARETYGAVGRLDTLDYLYGLRTGDEHTVPLGRGVSLILGLEAIGNPDERGMRTVMCTMNGQLRPIRVRDTSVKVDIKAAEKADLSKPGHVAAPFAGVVSVAVAEGDQVEAGQTVATIEAMKMEAAITTPVAGTVQRLALGSVQQVEGGDLVVVVTPGGDARMRKVFNFSAGPAVLPESVLRQAADEMLDWHGSGQSVTEMSHRGKEFTEIAERAEADLRTLLGVPDGYHVLFLQGGASLQFEMIPLNLLRGKPVVDYVHTGEWAKKAIAAARRLGRAEVNVAASAEDRSFTYVPDRADWRLSEDAAYVHYTANETIGGVEFSFVPEVGDVPLISDMSSTLLSRPLDVSRFGLIYAGAQKNIGPAGLTIVIVRDDLVGLADPPLTPMLDYATHVKAGSMYNTPPTYAIYLAGLVFAQLLADGGLAAAEQRNIAKAELLYGAIDDEPFYANPVEPRTGRG